MFRVVDSFITRWFQEGYNFIWNHFGITKGLICAGALLSVAVSHYVRGDSPLWWTVIILLILFQMSSVQLKYHGLQAKGTYRRINDKALECRESLMYLFIRILVIIFSFISLIDNKTPLYIVIFGTIPFITFIYLETCLVQDRELPEQKFEYNHGF